MSVFPNDIDGGNLQEPFLGVIAYQVVVYDRGLLASVSNAQAEGLTMREAIERVLYMTRQRGPRQELHGIEIIAEHAFYGLQADNLAKRWTDPAED